MSWPRSSIGQIADVKGGKRLPKGDQLQDQATDHPYLRIVDFNIYGVENTNIKYISNSTFDKISRYVISSKDIYISIAGTIGRVGIIPKELESANLTENAAKITNIASSVVSRFLLMYLRSYEGQGQLIGRAGGTSQPKLALYRIEEIDFPHPPVGVQNRIADILSAYDDLIENNRRRIGLLEAAARQLYKEWFVRFRFPGYEHVKIIDGVPEGWSRKPFIEMAEVIRGRSYTSEELRDEGGRAFVNLKCINRYGGFRDSGIKAIDGDFKDKHTVVPGDIVMAVTDMTRDAMIVAQSGRVPKTVEAGAVFSMDLVKISPADGVQPEWLYAMLRFSGFALDVREHANGTNVLHLKPKHIEEWQGLLPPTRLRAIFADAVERLFAQIDNLELQSRNAAKARDLLLPRLMSGAIAV